MTLRPRPFETLVVVSCLAALLVVGPLRGSVAAFPFVPFAAAVVLLAAPGALLARWFARELFPGVALVPAAMALGAGLYGLLGIPVLLTRQSLNLYLWACGAVLAAFLVTAAIVALRPGSGQEKRHKGDPSGAGARWLWPPFLVLGGVLVFFAGVKVPLVDGDTWNYLAWVREYLEPGRLALQDPYFGKPTPELSRVQINGYMLEQAALSRLSGVDPITLVVRLLSPTLVAVSLLAFYALARLLFKSAVAALIAGCLYALFLLFNLEPLPSAFGGEFLVRAVQDKGFARFVFLPVALCFAVAFLERRRLRHLALFGFVCWAVVGVHPVGLAIIGMSAAGLGLLHVTTDWRRRSAWLDAVALGAALLSFLLVPLAYVLFTGHPLSSALYSADIGASDPAVLANQVFVREEWRRILVLGNGSYIMHPSLVLNPVIATSYVLGVPFLIWRLWRGNSLAAQLLLGTLLVATVACYAPPVSTFLGDEVVAPGQLHRLCWPIPLAALLTLGWISWETAVWAARKAGLGPRAIPLLASVVVLLLSVAAAPQVFARAKEVYGFKNEQTSMRGARFDPVFRWMQHNIEKPGVVLAPNGESVTIPAYSANANVVSFRGAPVLDNLRELERLAGRKIKVPQGALDVREFYSDPAISEAGIREILRRQKVDYVLAYAGSPLEAKLDGMSNLTRLQTPGERYELFSVGEAGATRT